MSLGFKTVLVSIFILSLSVLDTAFAAPHDVLDAPEIRRNLRVVREPAADEFILIRYKTGLFERPNFIIWTKGRAFELRYRESLAENVDYPYEKVKVTGAVSGLKLEKLVRNSSGVTEAHMARFRDDRGFLDDLISDLESDREMYVQSFDPAEMMKTHRQTQMVWISVHRNKMIIKDVNLGLVGGLLTATLGEFVSVPDDHRSLVLGANFLGIVSGIFLSRPLAAKLEHEPRWKRKALYAGTSVVACAAWMLVLSGVLR